MVRSRWSVAALAAVATARPAPLKLQLHSRRPQTGRQGARSIGGSRDDTSRALILRGGSYDAYDDEWSGEGYAGGDAYDYGGAPPVDAPKPGLDAKGFVPDRKTGLIMCAAGAMATMLGISLFFEKNLIRVGNVLLVLGAPIVVGPQRASRYVLAPTKLRATMVFAFGFLLILSGRPLLGIGVEAFGFLNLFGNLFPMLGVMLKSLPFVPSGSGAGNSGGGGGDFGGMPMPPPQDDPYGGY
jgi:hypothetical protein